MLIDLHNHTSRYSDDSLLSPEQLVEGAKEAGLDGIAITEHDFFWDSKALIQLGKHMDFLVIPGVEINTEQGHLLVFGLERYVFGMHRPEFVKDMVDRRGGAMLIAHPHRRRFIAEISDPAVYEESLKKACGNSIFSMVDGVEVLNGRSSDRQNCFSEEIASRLRLKGIGTSDAHQAHDIGRYATRFEKRITDLEGLIEEVKAGRFTPEALD